jgi:hypothetical protein
LFYREIVGRPAPNIARSACANL